MHISSFNPIINNINKHNINKERSKFNNLSPLAQDTISFGASSSTRKLVEDLKKQNISENRSIKFSDIDKVYEYFGYKSTYEGHIKYTGPYGQYAIFKKQNPVDYNTAKDLIRSLKHVDELYGELVIFDHEPTKEELEEWKTRIAKRQPTPNYVNQYAIDNKERLDALLVQEEEPIEVDSSKEQEKAINELKCRLSNISVSISMKEEDFETLVGLYEEIKENAAKNKIEIPQEEIKKADQKIVEKREVISAAKSTLETYKDKISKNNMLSKEELTNLEEYENNGIDILDIGETVTNFEKIYSEQLSKQSELVRKILAEIEEFKSNIKLVNSQTQNIKKIIDEAAQNAAFKGSLINQLNDLYSSLEKKLSEINSKVNDYKKVKTTKELTSKLHSILKKIKEYNNGGLGESIPELLELNKLIETEVKPMLSMTEDEKTAKRIERIEKFNKRVEQSQVQSQQIPQKPTIEEQKKTIAEVDEPAITPTVETKPIEQKIEVSPAEKTAISLQEKRIQELKHKLAEKISRLPIATANEAILKIVEEKFDDLLFTELQNGNTTVEEFATKIVSAVVQTQDYNRIRNASQFALQNSIYINSTNKPSEIFNLNGPESREVFAEIQKGAREITVSTNGKPIKISIDKNCNLDGLAKTFERYNEKMIDIDSQTGAKVLDEILKYAPTFSEEELQKVLVKLSQEGAYYELLLNEDCNETLKTTLLETFWSNYDSAHKTNYTPQVISMYKAELNKIKEAEMQKSKLQSLGNHNWSLL